MHGWYTPRTYRDRTYYIPRQQGWHVLYVAQDRLCDIKQYGARWYKYLFIIAGSTRALYLCTPRLFRVLFGADHGSTRSAIE